MADLNSVVHSFSQTGALVMLGLLGCSLLLALSGLVNILQARPFLPRISSYLFTAAAGIFFLGFCLLSWFHYQIYQHVVLDLPHQMAHWLNGWLAAMNEGAAYGLPLYDPSSPPRYAIPIWIENQRYYFWFLCFAVMALFAHRRLASHRFRGALYLLLAAQVGILYFIADPFREPLPRFLAEVAPWFEMMGHEERLALFMRLYPRLVFYYNASYMWMHPPLLFISYACITLFFAASVFMLIRRELAIEALGYTYAKLGYFLLTLGMLLGYPWALKAWGPNWWWDPKICSSIMLWAVFSTYLHTRLYANKQGMWYFSAGLGIICFLAMIFTFIASYLFPGEHAL
jgi:ABC-type transport system involved in cytochrome c biogenesis permease subunit